MTREELRKIVEGITDEQLKSILDINSTDIGNAKKEVSDLKTKIDTLETNKKTLEDKITTLSEEAKDAETFKNELDKLKKEIKEKEETESAEKADKELTTAIEAVFGDKKFTSEYVRTGIIADMKKEIEKPENKGMGYDKIFETLTKDKEGIFANPNPPGNMGGMGPVDTDSINDDKIREVMGLPTTKKD